MVWFILFLVYWIWVLCLSKLLSYIINLFISAFSYFLMWTCSILSFPLETAYLKILFFNFGNYNLLPFPHQTFQYTQPNHDLLQIHGLLFHYVLLHTCMYIHIYSLVHKYNLLSLYNVTSVCSQTYCWV